MVLSDHLKVISITGYHTVPSISKYSHSTCCNSEHLETSISVQNVLCIVQLFRVRIYTCVFVCSCTSCNAFMRVWWWSVGRVLAKPAAYRPWWRPSVQLTAVARSTASLASTPNQLWLTSCLAASVQQQVIGWTASSRFCWDEPLASLEVSRITVCRL